MHELAIANSIVESVLHEVDKQQLPPVTKIVVRIGALSDVVPESLQFNFEVISKDTALEQSTLEIEQVPLEGKCKSCGREFSVEKFIFACPVCQSGQITVTRGEELDIAYIEVEDGK